MPRSPVLSGLVTQRDRAHLRSRLDRKRARTAIPENRVAELVAWLEAHVPRRSDVATLESLDLTRFLRDTASIDLEPDERLRHLSIFLERDLACADQPRGWLALDRIYTEAIRLDPRSVDVLVSRAVTAHHCAEVLPRPGTPRAEWVASPVRRRMMSVAHASIHKAFALDPTAADVVRRVGDLLYFDPDLCRQRRFATCL